MTTDANIAKQVIQDELEAQNNSAKAELEVLASRAEGTMVKAEVDARNPDAQIAGDPAEDARTKEIDRCSVAANEGRSRSADQRVQGIGERDRFGRRSRLAKAQGPFNFAGSRATESHDSTETDIGRLS